ncbi:hypothetical protein UCDDA912_g00946 [Diaporthe ampelina]|uniref:Uncharacterized protein n=1 Tax=Diaporthe ampelina TaxID=1214573 RepID=A0A0G2FYU6_9PEZI|nr:hypothetical protein UCDDA912_g00946 [Diaporthe ampelina]
MPEAIEQYWLCDLVVTETGNSQFVFNMTTLPHGSKVSTQAVYGSIGRQNPFVNNLEYTVERYFNGMEATNNDVLIWDYGAILRAMSPEAKFKSFKVDEAADLDALLSDEEVQNATYPQAS